MSVINVDMDGVVYDLVAVVKSRLYSSYGVDEELPDPTSWDFDNWNLPDRGIDVADFFEREAINRLFAFGYPVRGALRGIIELYQAGHELRVVTNKLKLGRGSWVAAMDAVMWLRGQGVLDFVDVVFTRTYGKQTYPADVVIDDHPDLEWQQPNAINLLFDQPWNQDIANVPLHSFERASGWDRILELLT